MGIIFNDSNDAQVESLMKNTHLGTTWAMRYLRSSTCLSAVATASGIVGTAVTDYIISKTTDHAGILGWLLG